MTEVPLPPAVLWADPGGMTGVALYARDTRMLVCDEFPFRQACDFAWEACRAWGTGLAVGWETYVVDPRKPQKDMRSAVEPIGVLRFAAQRFGCIILPEAARHTPNPRDRARLKALGWWVPGKDDAQSAACHLLRWMQRFGYVPGPLAVRLAELRAAR